jgi:hypothetical protein
MSTHPVRLLGATVLALCALAACKREETPPPKPAAAEAPAVPARTREQAIAQLMALPELKAWSEQIEKKPGGKAHGAVIEDDPAPRVLDGKPYYQLSFVENQKDRIHRRASFLVAQQGDDVLVEDDAKGTVESLSEWRRNIQRVELKAN